MADIKKLLKEARREVRDEFEVDAKRQIKHKLQAIDKARIIVANLENELQWLADSLEATWKTVQPETT